MLQAYGRSWSALAWAVRKARYSDRSTYIMILFLRWLSSTTLIWWYFMSYSAQSPSKVYMLPAESITTMSQWSYMEILYPFVVSLPIWFFPNQREENWRACPMISTPTFEVSLNSLRSENVLTLFCVGALFRLLFFLSTGIICKARKISPRLSCHLSIRMKQQWWYNMSWVNAFSFTGACI